MPNMPLPSACGRRPWPAKNRHAGLLPRVPPMTARALSCVLAGIVARPIEVEVDVAGGLPHFTIVGLPGGAVRESKDRVRAALRNVVALQNICLAFLEFEADHKWHPSQEHAAVFVHGVFVVRRFLDFVKLDSNTTPSAPLTMRGGR